MPGAVGPVVVARRKPGVRSKRKQWRGLATRYEKSATIYLALGAPPGERPRGADGRRTAGGVSVAEPYGA
ncbi:MULTISPECIES: hypothetical protein [unclassified Streptomyces]|uniref:hypothetical protein n=1 Tax=unclassified Streptomyces TaxID=2593676 RepID=UPI00224CC111|nr:hypothetical protein [Streptomyces sp. NBC_00047]MCX5610195.1 hypothetical protein [Streptomyces sp. NBC_00047]